MSVTYTKSGRLTRRSVRSLYSQWTKGRTKVSIERELGVTNAHGKYATRLFQRELGVSSVRVSAPRNVTV